MKLILTTHYPDLPSKRTKPEPGLWRSIYKAWFFASSNVPCCISAKVTSYPGYKKYALLNRIHICHHRLYATWVTESMHIPIAILSSWIRKTSWIPRYPLRNNCEMAFYFAQKTSTYGWIFGEDVDRAFISLRAMSERSGVIAFQETVCFRCILAYIWGIRNVYSLKVPDCTFYKFGRCFIRFCLYDPIGR